MPRSFCSSASGTKAKLLSYSLILLSYRSTTVNLALCAVGGLPGGGAVGNVRFTSSPGRQRK